MVIIEGSTGVTGSDMLNSLIMYGGTDLSPDATLTDDNAQYKVISKTLDSDNVGSVFSKLIDAPKGLYSVMIRMKVNNIVSSENAFTFSIRNSDSVSTGVARYIKPSMFNSVDTYKTLGVVVENITGKLNVTLTINRAIENTEVSVDYIAIAPAMVGITSIA